MFGSQFAILPETGYMGMLLMFGSQFAILSKAGYMGMLLMFGSQLAILSKTGYTGIPSCLNLSFCNSSLEMSLDASAAAISQLSQP